MTNEIATAPAPSGSLTERTASRFGIDPKRLLPTLKATCFKSGTPASDEQMIALLIVAEQYHLNPFTKELYAYPDKGGIVPVVSVDGWARIINEHPMLDGIDFEYGPDGSWVTCILHRKDRAHPIRITEFLDECIRSTEPWRKSPRRMLRHKSLIQCARIAFGFAGIYDEDEAQRIVEVGPKSRAEPPSSAAARVREAMSPRVDSDTGEIEDARQVERQVETEDERLPMPDTLANYRLLIEQATDIEPAALVLDEARDILSAADHATLSDAFRARWSTPE
jgi:phage recombination protein Bet